MSDAINPLKQFFRQPAIYIRLPSGGKFWQAGSLDMPQNGELPVLPMTAMDEITYRTPDALFSGQSVVDVIQSCMPSIRNAWSVPSIDVNAILVAIRIASYGHNMEIETTCPACTTQDTFEIDLRSALDQLDTPNYDQPLTIGDLSVYFKPITYEQQNLSSLDQFTGQKMLQNMASSELDDNEKLQRMQDVLKEITALTVKAIAASIACINTPQALVSEPVHILEFLQNCDAVLYNQIRDQAVALKTSSDFKPIAATCTNCSTQYQTPMSLDQTNFFVRAS